MKNLLNVSENETLESIVFTIAKTAYEKEEFDRCQLWILDSVTRKTLSDKSQEMVKMPQIPEVPAKLLTYLERYREVGFISRFLFSIVKMGRRCGRKAQKNSKSIKHITLPVPYIFVP